MATTVKDFLRLIREHCIECCGYSAYEADRCPAEKCHLWAYRQGKDPNKRVMSEEDRKALAERLKKGRESKNGAD